MLCYMGKRDALQDIGLYFVHWLVDLAGAEPHPLEGGAATLYYSILCCYYTILCYAMLYYTLHLLYYIILLYQSYCCWSCRAVRTRRLHNPIIHET